MRAGQFIQQSAEYKAFIPVPLPPDPPLATDPELTRLLSDADRDLGRLDGVATTLPSVDLFVAMYVRQEAVFSSQIEGTQSTLEDVLEYEAGAASDQQPRDVEEVVNYVRAMNHGLARLPELPLSLRLIREVHAELLKGVRGEHRAPGEFRRTQNWIGPAGCTLATAAFVPPPPHEMQPALYDLEKFLHEPGELPVLVQAALMHAQFETIHPFLDGNGRVGRLLITLLLCERRVLHQPLLYLSHYFKVHRAEYYDRLTAVRVSGDWEGWAKFFLRGVSEVSRGATGIARAILALREEHRDQLVGDSYALRLLDAMYRQPVLNIRTAERLLGCKYDTAAKAIGGMEDLGIVREITGKERNRMYRYEPYIKLFERPMVGDGSRGMP